MKNKFTKIVFIFLLTLMLFALVTPVLAQFSIPNEYKPDYAPAVALSESAQSNPANYVSLVLNTLAGGLLILAAPIAIIIIAVAGLFAVISHGKPELLEKSKKTLIGAIIGLLIIIFSWVIIRGVVDLMLSTGSGQIVPVSQEQQNQINSEVPTEDATDGDAASQDEDRRTEDLDTE